MTKPHSSLLPRDGRPVLIAEISGNHKGSRSRFFELVHAAAESGADYVKFQTYTPDTLTLPLDTAAFRMSDDHSLWGGRSLYSLYAEAMTPWEWQGEGFELARKLGLGAFSSPFDRSAVDFLEQFNPPAYKIASLEATDADLVQYVASQGRSVLISGGAASLAEIATAVDLSNSCGARETIPLVCTSAYPASPQDARLKRITDWTNVFGCPVGLSDHTLGIGVAVAGVALGAAVVEKHLTLSRDDGAVDSAFSMEPDELAQLATEMESAWMAVMTPPHLEVAAEDESRRFRRSLYVSEDVEAGDKITRRSLRSIRPSGGLDTIWLSSLIGLRYGQDIKAGTPMRLELLSATDVENEDSSP